jgi:hypothetical protein
MKTFYTPYLMGGLGNQLFQISNCLSKSWSNGVNAKFKKDAYLPMQGNNPKHYIDNIYKNISFEDNLSCDNRVSENSFAFSEINLPTDKSCELYGYFQSSKYFTKYSKVLKKLFSPSDEFIKKISNQYPDLNLKNTVSIHVRRGDYKNISHVLPTIDISYFNFCLQEIGDYDKIFIFSDDIDWVLENMKYPNSIVVQNLEDYECLWMMSLCKHHIMSNSSFSWWGTYLSNDFESKVYAPDTWFGPSGPQDFHDIYEENWNKIKTEYNEGILYFKN